MQICILGFEGSHSADDAYGEVLDAEGVRNPWLLEVGTIARPLLGRVRVGVTFPDGDSKTFHEGDFTDAAAELGGLTGYYVSALAGPFGSLFAMVDAESEAASFGSDVEQRLFHMDEIKKVLHRDSSALVLVAQDNTCDALVELFDGFSPTVVRIDVAPALRARLRALEVRAQQVSEAQAAEASASL